MNVNVVLAAVVVAVVCLYGSHVQAHDRVSDYV